MAHIDLWLDGAWCDPMMSWDAEVNLDLERMQDDPVMYGRVKDHIKQALDNLAKEVEEIGLHYGRIPLPSADRDEGCVQ